VHGRQSEVRKAVERAAARREQLHGIAHHAPPTSRKLLYGPPKTPIEVEETPAIPPFEEAMPPAPPVHAPQLVKSVNVDGALISVYDQNLGMTTYWNGEDFTVSRRMFHSSVVDAELAKATSYWELVQAGPATPLERVCADLNRNAAAITAEMLGLQDPIPAPTKAVQSIAKPSPMAKHVEQLEKQPKHGLYAPEYEAMAVRTISHFLRQYMPLKGTVVLVGDMPATEARLGVQDHHTVYRGSGTHAAALPEYDVAVVYSVFSKLGARELKVLNDKLEASLKHGGCILVFDSTAATDIRLTRGMGNLLLAGRIEAGHNASDLLQHQMADASRPVTLHNSDKIFQYGSFAGWAIFK
jgi:hypothetical protein